MGRRDAGSTRVNGALRSRAVRSITATALPLARYDALTQGAGSLNAAGAVTLAGSIDTSRARGSWWLGSGRADQGSGGRAEWPGV